MLCQNCHERPASIHLFTKVNGQSREIDLCQHCYQELKNQQGNQGKMNNNEFFGDFDDLFNALNGNNNNAANNNNEMRNNDPRMQMGGGAGNGGQNGRSLLDQYGTDLTALAKKGKIDPVIGRDKEIARVIEILNRRTKNNPVLIGEAGVGKTAVVEGLAQEIVD
ncbi:MAG: ATP-dependent Clp protease ATP-binding subunit, partial [Lactobacillus crispatus]|nr:ATP-dependent Clp protease ATP-binding subunit [Lactobacillus crispatus]MCT7709705.1 ATP-dependent Clp protease ATP-binding subunit [Lactobacillus crispatus]